VIHHALLLFDRSLPGLAYGFTCFICGALYGLYRDIKQPLLLRVWAEKVVAIQTALEDAEARGSALSRAGRKGGVPAGGPRGAGSAGAHSTVSESREVPA